MESWEDSLGPINKEKLDFPLEQNFGVPVMALK